jgi:hypothetical protein
MTSRKTISNRKLSFQQLEDRQLMAGNVTAAMSGASLTLTGDSKDNAVLIYQPSNAVSKYLVEGEAGTKINGKNSQTFTVNGNISVNFKDGNDTLNVGQANPGAFTILPGSLNVVLGGGNNSFGMTGTTINGNLTLTGGAGKDQVVMDTSSIGRGGNHDCNINLGGGSNQLIMRYTTVERDLLVYDNSGNSFDDVELFGGSVGRNASIQTGTGNDFVQINEFYFGKDLNIQTGAGKDTVLLGESQGFGGAVNIPTEDLGVHTDTVMVNLGDGDDILRTYNVSGSPYYEGGAGTDDLFHDSPSDGPVFDSTGFEYIDGFKAMVSTQHSTVTKVKA